MACLEEFSGASLLSLKKDMAVQIRFAKLDLKITRLLEQCPLKR